MKLSDSIEEYLQSHEPDPEHVYRLSPWLPIFAIAVLVILGLAFALPILHYTAIALLLLLFERRRVCRMEISPVGLRCYGLTGKRILDISRFSVQDVDMGESEKGKDFYFWANGERHRIPYLYEGLFEVAGILEIWAEENRRRVRTR